jgi:hypothetical protein
MNPKPNQPDTAIDKTLAALNAAIPPEGLEARIAVRLAAQPAPAPSWRDRLTGPTPSAAWWRGAATGAVFALLTVAAVLLIQHKTPRTTRIAVAAPAPTLANTPVSFAVSTAPCAHTAILRAPRPIDTPSPAILLAKAGTESAAPSHPAPVLPLTAQERALARLARTANPQQLAALSSEPTIKPESTAASSKSSTSLPAPPAPELVPAANPEPAPEAAPQTESVNPPASPAMN